MGAIAWPTAAPARPTTPPEPATLRDEALRRMRAADLTPAWFTSANWDNRLYQPWTDYLTGRLTEPEFDRVCARPSDYCLRDVWNLRRADAPRIDWAAASPFNWNGIHALAMRFFRTGDDAYLAKWLAVVDSHAAFAADDAGRAGSPMQRGVPAALLDSALTWGGIFTAWSMIAKGLRPAPAAGQSPYRARADAADALAPGEPARLPAATVARIVDAFLAGPAPLLARFYADARYVPNQRAYGIEALACAAAFFPAAAATANWIPELHTAIDDLARRYQAPDGTQLEASFNYAQALVEMLQRTTNLPFDGASPWQTAAQSAARGWWRMAAALATPDGSLPQLGNAVWGRFGRNAPPQRFGTPSFVFPYAGLAVQRGRWAGDTPYLFFYHRRAARGHTMAASNSVQLAAFGRQLLAAGGTALYGGPGAGRPELMAYLAETSSAKACTVMVDGRSQAGASSEGLALGADGRPDITRAPAQPAPMRWLASAEIDLVEAEYREGYRGRLDDAQASLVDDVRHQRCVIFVRALSLWLVVDRLRSPGTHEYTQVWKFPPPDNGSGPPGFLENQVDVRPAERIVQTVDAAPGAANLQLRHFGAPTLQYRRFFGSGGHGWHAGAALSAPVPAVDVHARWRGRGDQVLLTLLLPLRGRELPLARIDDGSADGVAGCALQAADGTRVVLAAAPSPAALQAGPVRQRAATLLALQRPDGGVLGLALDDAAAWRFEGADARRRQAIEPPRGFRWIEGPDRVLTPDYQPGR